MKKIFFIILFSLIISVQFIFAHTREMMMQVVNSSGGPIVKTVQLYIDRGLFYELYRTGTSTSYWKWTASDANVACDVGDNNTVQPTWVSINPGTYVLRCENKYAILDVNAVPIGDGDFNIKYQNEGFTLIYNNRGVFLGTTQNWDNKIAANFKQFKSDGLSTVGTVAIGKESSFSDRYLAPFNFYVSPNQNYLFHADTNIIASEKYRTYDNINDVVNFRNQYLGTVDYSTSAIFNSTFLGITIKNYFLEAPTLDPASDMVQFKDPWLIDYNDPLHGYKRRNRGMDNDGDDALQFKQRNSPFYPDYTTSYSGDVYKGVFLNQGLTQGQWVAPYYSVKAQQTQNINLGSALGTRAFYFQNWTTSTATSATLQNANALETGVVFKEANATVSANYKGHLLSNNSAGFSSNSQRKFISDNNGYKHLVYESQCNVWYTKSTDNGATWLQEVKLNEDGTQAKGATFAYSSGDGYMYILYQCDHGTWGNTNPTLILSQYSNIGTFRWREEVCELSSYAFNTMPTISAISGVVLVVYKPNATGGLVGKEYWLNSGNITLIYDRIIPGTYSNCVNPSLAICETTQPRKYMLVYEQSGIQYMEWVVTTDFYGLVTSNISSGSGFTRNFNPSIIECNGGGRVVWIGERGTLPSLSKTEAGSSTNIIPQYERRTFFKDASYNHFWSFGSLVNSPTINKPDPSPTTAYVFSWSETNGTVTNKFADNSLSTIRTLNTTGKDLQLCNGADKYSMFALSFTNTALPYNFALSNSIGSVALAKENTSLSVNKGREGVVVKDSSQIYFTLGDVLVNGENISFKTIPDTFSVTSVADVNNCVKTNPFSVTDNSALYYSVQYGVSDAEQLKRAFTESDVVSFRIELVDAATETVLGVFDNISYTKQNAVSYDNFSYEVSTEGIGNRTVYLRLVTTTSEGCSFFYYR